MAQSNLQTKISKEQKIMSEYMDAFWAFVFYATGTATGSWFVWKKQSIDTIGMTIDSLCADGYIKHLRNDSGEIELYKWDENIDSKK